MHKTPKAVLFIVSPNHKAPRQNPVITIESMVVTEISSVFVNQINNRDSAVHIVVLKHISDESLTDKKK